MQICICYSDFLPLCYDNYCFFSLAFLHTAEVPHLISLTTLELGGNATFHCPFSEKADRFFHWYKQSLGKMCVLTINHINKEDEATYFFISVQTLLLIHHTDYNHQTSVYVTQTPKSSSVQLGNTVTLQCSFLTKNKESSAQCPSDRSVHWFKSGSGENHPSIIYRNFTHSNNMDDTERQGRRCVHSLSKTIQNSSDAGIYYCAVVTCGEIVFGEGTQVETTKLDPVVLALGVLLAFSVTVNIIFVFCKSQRGFKNGKGTCISLHYLSN
uniref:Ig-like domain-containing protein n=1 Tax=Pundamilia nyererei TaxID=303518 RepID=A0A3B4GUV8_9CICH